ncbi:DUF4349 domain-containing protein [Microbacterium sp. NPDC091382]|uniref:DUF4349 domain-containing protein n=1 Tax=Microbacterium sp. NPDC091382 TaxID=3364210 RepID=UPI0037F4410C
MTGDDIVLPTLTRTRQDEIERALFAEIAEEERPRRGERDRRRRRGWAYAGAAAAVVVIAGFLGPALGGGVGSDGASSSAGGATSEESITRPDGEGTEMSGGTQDFEDSDAAATSAGERVVVARAEARLEAGDPGAAAEKIGDGSQASGGYVESLNVTGARPGGTGEPGDARITVRVPASTLTRFLRDLDELGTVRAIDISRNDVTAETTDLRARITALETSVERLRGLISAAATTADVLASEDALAQRQAELDSLRAQEKAFSDDVAMSTVTISISVPGRAVAAEPEGFGDGVSTGWSALLVTLNGVVIGLGFLLPWLAVAAVVILVVRVVRRVRRSRRASGTTDGS